MKNLEKLYNEYKSNYLSVEDTSNLLHYIRSFSINEKKYTDLKEEIENLVTDLFQKALEVDHAEYLDLFNKSPRLRNSITSINISQSDFFNVNKDNHDFREFPNDIWKSNLVTEDMKKISNVSLTHTFNEFELKRELPNIKKAFGKSNVMSFIRYALGDKELDKLQILFKEFLDLRYHNTNYPFGDFWEGNRWSRKFLSRVNTWGQLYKVNKDWFEYLCDMKNINTAMINTNASLPDRLISAKDYLNLTV